MPPIAVLLTLAWGLVVAGCAAAETPSPPRPPPEPATVAVPAAPAPPCPARAADLPDSPLYSAADAQWRGSAVIVVLKEKRHLGVYEAGALATTATGVPACWPVGLASTYAAGHKQRQGDMRTPEGWQRTSDRPWSQFYHALTVHYPGPADARRGLAAGLIDQAQHDAILSAHRRGRLPPMNTKLGGLIALHGGGGGSDWTLGCIALDNDHIDAMRALLPSDMRTDLLVLP